MTNLTAQQIGSNVKAFREGVNPSERDASFDYCFNYFQRFREEGRLNELKTPEHVQESCIQLGFYLASWGMYRGSGYLFKKSAKILEPIIGLIADQAPSFWEIDVHSYSDENIKRLLDFKTKIVSLPEHKGATDVLVTKIMLGVFGNVPAFDTYFGKGFGHREFKEKSLKAVADFYQDKAQIIDECRCVTHTIDFNTGQETPRLYTRAKIVDMVFFIEGEKKGEKIGG
jgi:hypothetical protein